MTPDHRSDTYRVIIDLRSESRTDHRRSSPLVFIHIRAEDFVLHCAGAQHTAAHLTELLFISSVTNILKIVKM